MSKNDLLTLDGRVSDLSGGGVYHITLDNGVLVSARLYGKMKRFKIKVVVGDTVPVGISPYNTSHGLILHRHKNIKS